MRSEIKLVGQFVRLINASDLQIPLVQCDAYGLKHRHRDLTPFMSGFQVLD
jgi:hypothetical protein